MLYSPSGAPFVVPTSTMSTKPTLNFPEDIEPNQMIQDPYIPSWEDTNAFCQAPYSTQVRQTPRISNTWKEEYIDAGYDCMKQSLETLSKQMAAAHISPSQLQQPTQPQMLTSLQMQRSLHCKTAPLSGH